MNTDIKLNQIIQPDRQVNGRVLTRKNPLYFSSFFRLFRSYFEELLNIFCHSQVDNGLERTHKLTTTVTNT